MPQVSCLDIEIENACPSIEDAFRGSSRELLYAATSMQSSERLMGTALAWHSWPERSLHWKRQRYFNAELFPRSPTYDMQ